MIKILFFADSHLGFDYPIRPRIERRRRGYDFFHNYQIILDTARREGVDAIIHGGDVFFRSKIPQLVIQKTYEPLLPLLDAGIQMFFVPGNHERSRLPASQLFHHTNMHLFDRPRSYTMRKDGISLKLGGFPNIRHQIQRDFQHYFDEIGMKDLKGQKNILCLHQSIENAVVGSQNYRFKKNDPDVIALNQFPDMLDLVLSGHIHRQQVLRSQGGIPVIYPGSIERTSFAEKLETKGYYMVYITGDDIWWEFRQLPARPMIEWSLPQALSDSKEIRTAIMDQVDKLPDDAIFRIRASKLPQFSKLKLSEIREIFPDTMNVDISPPRGTSRYRWSAYSD